MKKSAITVGTSLVEVTQFDTRSSQLIGVRIKNNGPGAINQCEVWGRMDTSDGTFTGYKGAADWAAAATDQSIPFVTTVLPNAISSGSESTFHLFIGAYSDISLKLKSDNAATTVDVEISVKSPTQR